MHELTATREPDDVVVTLAQGEVVPHGIEEPFDRGECPLVLGTDLECGIEHVAEHVRIARVMRLGKLRCKHECVQCLKVG